MRCSLSADGLTAEDFAAVKGFISQFGGTEIPKKNFRARYDALLLMAYTIIRNPEKTTVYLYKCDGVLNCLTDDLSKMKVLVALFACTGKRAYADLAHALTDKWKGKELKGGRKELTDDLGYYESHADNIPKLKDFVPLEMPRKEVPMNPDGLPKGRGGFISFVNGYIREQRRSGKVLSADRNVKVIKNFSKYLKGEDIAFALFTKETVESYRAG